MNLVELIEESAVKFPEKDAVIFRDIRYSYSEILRAIEDFAPVLARAGIRKQQRVGIMFPNSPEYIVAFFALLKCDAVVVPISSDLGSEDISHMLTSMEIEHLVVQREFVPLFSVVVGFAQCEIPLKNGFLVTTAVASLHHGPGSEDLKNLSRIHVANIRFTSGTTSRSKGVVLSHDTIFERLNAANRYFSVTEKDTIIWTLSMAHHFAATICCHLMVGATIVISTSLLPGSLIRLISNYKGTVVYATPMLYKLMVAHRAPHGDAFSTVRLCVSTAMNLMQADALEFYRKFHIPLTNAFGMIEIGIPLVNTLNDIDKASSIGSPVSGYEVKIIDEDFAEAEHGQVGHLAIKGPGMLDAYCRPWRMREEILKDGWFISGDLAKKEKDGYIYIVGRDSDIINVGGMKVFPYEVENTLSAFPGVKEVVVSGIEDKRFGQAVLARIVPFENASISENELMQFCREKISFFKIPKKIEFVSSLPRTATGKLLRRNTSVSGR